MNLVYSLFLDNNMQHMLKCVKTICSTVGEFKILKMHICPQRLSQGDTVSTAFAAVIALVFTLQTGDGPEVLPHSDTVFQHKSLLHISTRILYNVLSWASMSSQLGGKCHTLTFVNSCKHLGWSSPLY